MFIYEKLETENGYKPQLDFSFYTQSVSQLVIILFLGIITKKNNNFIPKMNKGFIKTNKGVKLDLTFHSDDREGRNYLSLLGRIHRLKKMLEKREMVIKEWSDEIKILIQQDILKIKSEISERIIQLNSITYTSKNKKEVYKVRLDVTVQKNGSKFYRGRINIPKSDRVNFKLKQPRKEFLIKRNEVRILVRKLNNQKQNIL